MIPRKPRPADQDPRFRYDPTGLQIGLNWDAIRVEPEPGDDE